MSNNSESESDYATRLEAWVRNRFAPPPDPPRSPRRPDRIEMVPMSDGVRLYTEIFLPKVAKHYPAVLHRSPYPFAPPSRDDIWDIGRYLEAGFAFVFQSTRGQHKSEGEYVYYKCDLQDGYDCIEWIAEQSWCNGSVGMEGSSYAGCTQLFAARTLPPALKCIMPTAFFGSLNVGFPYSGGVPGRGWFMQWYRVLDTNRWEDLDAPYGDMGLSDHPRWGPAYGKSPLIDAADAILEGDKLKSWRKVFSHPPGDPYWDDVVFSDADLSDLDLPIFLTDGWYDPTIGPSDYFQRFEKIQPGREDLYLLIGPWNHAQTYLEESHDKPNGSRGAPANGSVDLIGQRLAFFKRYLYDDESVEVQKDRVKVYVTGLNEWRSYSTFPPPGMQERALYLHSDGRADGFPGDGYLSFDACGDEPTDAYIYDPNFATPAVAKGNDPICDQRLVEIRGDVAVYTSACFERPLTLLGDLKLVFYAASSCVDTDWVVRVTEVFPDGRSIPFHGRTGVLRARYREGYGKEVFLTPNEPAMFEIALGSAGHQFAVGSRLRLSIASAASPGIDANKNTGQFAPTDTDSNIAKQTIFHNSECRSRLILPMLE